MRDEDMFVAMIHRPRTKKKNVGKCGQNGHIIGTDSVESISPCTCATSPCSTDLEDLSLINETFHSET
ncbi:MAG: hypothetical protein Phog2KO_49420 [Phototrophicaceae bacterium]